MWVTHPENLKDFNQACSFLVLAIAQVWSEDGHDFLALQAFLISQRMVQHQLQLCKTLLWGCFQCILTITPSET